MLTIYPARTGAHHAHVRALFEEYAASLPFDLAFQHFDEELAALPGGYAPPDGALLLAEADGQVAGCVALRRLDPTACEMKRLFVHPAFRGLGIGRALAEAAIAEARRRGYALMRLDTLDGMDRAQALYRALGFRETAPYRFNPLEGAHFMALRLN